MRELLEALAVGAVSDHAEHRVDAALPRRSDDLEDCARGLYPGHPADPADDERVLRDPVQAAIVEIRRLVAEPLVERDAEPDHGELVHGRDPVLHELVPDLRAHGHENVGAAREVALDLPEECGASRTEVALQHVPVERVDDDRWSCVPGDERGGSRERACLGGVRVQDVRPLLAHDRREASDRSRVVQQGHLPLHLRYVDDRHSEPLGDVRHRVLAAREAARDEGGVVAARLEPGGEVRHVDRRPAHVEPRNDAQDADRLRHGADLSEVP